MATDNYVRSYGDLSRVEDVVLNAVEILTARENMIFNMLGKTDARDTIHSFLVDTLRTPASAAVAESADYTMEARTTPTRLTNIVQNTVIPFGVSRTQQKVQHYHGENELDRQVRKAVMDWANAAEFDLVRATLTSGASGTTATMSKLLQYLLKYITIKAWIKTVNTAIKNSMQNFRNTSKAKPSFVLGNAMQAI